MKWRYKSSLISLTCFSIEKEFRQIQLTSIMCGLTDLTKTSWDHKEGSDNLRRGLLVGFFGNSTNFSYGVKIDTKNAAGILLDSGDVLIFGSKSKSIFYFWKGVLAMLRLILTNYGCKTSTPHNSVAIILCLCKLYSLGGILPPNASLSSTSLTSYGTLASSQSTPCPPSCSHFLLGLVLIWESGIFVSYVKRKLGVERRGGVSWAWMRSSRLDLT
ncbi:hypothetical protein OSB04_un000783 [Centaurea solstitialis]|uniref:Uncharacterized protein n=1 Tax=Centaurea solstitialis TaxID=347529 RepID=A0AA38VV72_9ASTR|nr:hypothetical protein OSB04_un000783 [Centaurea solstitialis]